jgi:hypothetical protein
VLPAMIDKLRDGLRTAPSPGLYDGPAEPRTRFVATSAE